MAAKPQDDLDDQTLDASVQALRAEVIRLAGDPSCRVLTIMDGGFFDDLPALLGQFDLSHDTLYKGASLSYKATGPILVDPYHPAPMTEAGRGGGDREWLRDPVARLNLLLDMAERKPCIVFWVGGATFDAGMLFRHLRTLNKILVPRGWGRSDGQETDDRQPEQDEAVLFRHADGNVLAQVLPALEPRQRARFVGPAEAILFLAPEHPSPTGSVAHRTYSPAVLPSPPGMLRLSENQMYAVERRRLMPSVLAYLRRNDSGRIARNDPSNLERRVDGWLQSGQAHGLSGPAGLKKWCYLQLFARGRLEDTPGLSAYVRGRRGDGMADARVDALMTATISTMRSKG